MHASSKILAHCCAMVRATPRWNVSPVMMPLMLPFSFRKAVKDPKRIASAISFGKSAVLRCSASSVISKQTLRQTPVRNPLNPTRLPRRTLRAGGHWNRVDGHTGRSFHATLQPTVDQHRTRAMGRYQHKVQRRPSHVGGLVWRVDQTETT